MGEESSAKRGSTVVFEKEETTSAMTSTAKRSRVAVVDTSAMSDSVRMAKMHVDGLVMRRSDFTRTSLSTDVVTWVLRTSRYLSALLVALPYLSCLGFLPRTLDQQFDVGQ